jgi:hypothetical protein
VVTLRRTSKHTALPFVRSAPCNDPILNLVRVDADCSQHRYIVTYEQYSHCTHQSQHAVYVIDTAAVGNTDSVQLINKPVAAAMSIRSVLFLSYICLLSYACMVSNTRLCAVLHVKCKICMLVDTWITVVDADLHTSKHSNVAPAATHICNEPKILLKCRCTCKQMH